MQSNVYFSTNRHVVCYVTTGDVTMTYQVTCHLPLSFIDI
uniref:Uncharacterized protein n=1 Tax=Anguilla anguilla TaxID=7936 RepID=A0A0E9S432_ANGAN